MRNQTQKETDAAADAIRNAPKGPELGRLLRKYRRGSSQPRLIDIASATARGNAGVIQVLKAFAK